MRSTRGFTAIELLVVVISIAIIDAVLTPALQTARVTANESDAILGLREVSRAQHDFHEQHGSYAPTLQDLIAAGLLKLPLDGKGKLQGYDFNVATSQGSPGRFEASAQPEVTTGIVRTGDRSFFVDETGVIRSSHGCPPGQHVDTLNQCVPDEPQPHAQSGPINNVPTIGVGTIERLDLATGGQATALARKLLGEHPNLPCDMLNALRREDGSIGFDADALQKNETITEAKFLFFNPGLADLKRIEIGSDAVLNPIVEAFTAQTDALLQPGVGNEIQLPHVTPPEQECDPKPAMAFLELVAPFGPYASLDVLRGIIQQLALPGGRERAVLANVDDVVDALRAEQVVRARSELLELRRSIKSDAVASQIDVILQQLSSPRGK
jgi:type II secretory pathway pseudopilin PulG